MTGYDLFLSNGSSLTTINVKTIDEQAHTSLILIGQGIPDYGTPIAQDLVWMLENFAKSTPPVHPLEGQHWYDQSRKRMNFYNGSEWQNIAFIESSFANKFDMALASQNLDFTIAGTTAIFTGANPSKIYCPIEMILLPRGIFNATVPATIDLSVSASGDVLSSTSIPNITTSRFIKVQMNQRSAFIAGTGTLNLNVTTPASGGLMNYDVYIFGAVF